MENPNDVTVLKASFRIQQTCVPCTCRTLCVSCAGVVHLFSALDGSWMSVPGLDGPCADAVWDAQHPNIFLACDGKQMSTFTLKVCSLDVPGALSRLSAPAPANTSAACMHDRLF